MFTSTKQAQLLDKQRCYIKTKQVIENRIDDEVVMAHFATDKYYGLNPVATRIWQLLATACSLEQLCTTLCQEYEVEWDECHQAVADFLQSLLRARLIQPAGE